MAHQRARGPLREEVEGLIEDVRVDRAPEVEDRLLPGLGEEGGREVGAEPLEGVEADDGDRHLAKPGVRVQDIVEDELDHVHEGRVRQTVHDGGEPPHEDQRPVRLRVGEETARELERTRPRPPQGGRRPGTRV